MKRTVSRSRSTDGATEHVDWAGRPSQTLHGEQPGKDRAARAARPIPRRPCTQASLIHLQPPDDRSQHPHDRTKAQQINGEPCLPRQNRLARGVQRRRNSVAPALDHLDLGSLTAAL